MTDQDGWADEIEEGPPKEPKPMLSERLDAFMNKMLDYFESSNMFEAPPANMPIPIAMTPQHQFVPLDFRDRYVEQLAIFSGRSTDSVARKVNAFLEEKGSMINPGPLRLHYFGGEFHVMARFTKNCGPRETVAEAAAIAAAAGEVQGTDARSGTAEDTEEPQ
jgi:hypothetical protein